MSLVTQSVTVIISAPASVTFISRDSDLTEQDMVGINIYPANQLLPPQYQRNHQPRYPHALQVSLILIIIRHKVVRPILGRDKYKQQ